LAASFICHRDRSYILPALLLRARRSRRRSIVVSANKRELHGFFAIVLGNAIFEFANPAAGLAHSHDFIASRNETYCTVIFGELLVPFQTTCARGIHLYKRPTITVNATKDFLGISYPNANNLIDKFCKNELLFEVTGNSRNPQFLHTPYIDVFGSIQDQKETAPARGYMLRPPFHRMPR
jgi:hypothetical protein